MTIQYELYKINQAITDSLEFREERETDIFHEIKNDYSSEELARTRAHEKALEEMQDTLDCLKMEKDEKIEELLQSYMNIEALKESIEEKIADFKRRIETLNGRLESIEYAIRIFTDGKGFESSTGKVSYRKSDVADIIDMAEIPLEYKAVELKKIPVAQLPVGMEEYIKQYVPDKTAIKKTIKEKIKEAQENGEGEEVIEAIANAAIPGARLVFKQNMTIK